MTYIWMLCHFQEIVALNGVTWKDLTTDSPLYAGTLLRLPSGPDTGNCNKKSKMTDTEEQNSDRGRGRGREVTVNDALLAHTETVADTRMFLVTMGDIEPPTEAAAHVLP
jgi:hypothetical protein